MGRPKETCRRCHFLVKTHIAVGMTHPAVFHWTRKERREFSAEDFYGVECWKGVWSTGSSPGLRGNLRGLLTLDRRGNCPFVEWREHESLSAGDERRAVEQTRRVRRRRNVRWGIAAVVIPVLLFLLSLWFGSS